MATEEKGAFGEYASEPQTAGGTPEEQTAQAVKIEAEKYGINKPHRLIVRGKIAADTGTDDQRD